MEAEAEAPDISTTPQPDPNGIDYNYVYLFMLKYTCPYCGKMAVPVLPDSLKCTVCGATRAVSSFMAEVEEFID